MSNKNYIRGRSKEYLAKKELENEGYYVVRSAGSHSIVDLFAFSVGEIKFIQIKRQKVAAQYTTELEALRELKVPVSKDVKVSKEFWIWTDRKGWTKLYIT
jgi:Holliday junction resolvase